MMRISKLHYVQYPSFLAIIHHLRDNDALSSVPLVWQFDLLKPAQLDPCNVEE